MKLIKNEYYRVVDVPQSSPCFNCKPCIRLRMMEMGFVCGEIIRVKQHSLGIYLVALLTKEGTECQSIALREDEANRIIFEKIS